MSPLTARSVVVERYGPPEAMRLTSSTVGEPGPGQARVRVRRIGVNFMDLATCEGFNPAAPLPATLGVEGAGVVDAVGEDVDDLTAGRRVAWYYIPGSYTDVLLAPAASLVPVPDGIDDDTAAATLMQGLTASHLAELARPGGVALVHSAAGGVGALLTQMLTAAGTTVIARVSGVEKQDAARRAGAAHILVGRDPSFALEVERLVGTDGVDIVFDGTGAETYRDSVACLKPHGVYAYYGGADGEPDPILLSELPKSILLTHPVVMHHVPTRQDLLDRSASLFADIAAGTLRIAVGARYPLHGVADAHRAMRSRRTTGKLLLHP